MQLANSTILITGGSSGIGLEFLKQLSQHNVTKIIITGRDGSKLEQIKQQFPHIHTVKSDVSDSKEIGQLYNNITKEFPALNIIINNAGIMRNMDLQDTSMDLGNITEEIDTNLSGTIRMVHQFLPHLKKKSAAAIVNISSGLAFIPFPLSPVYSATKAGIHSYTQILRLQLKHTNVKIFEVAPPSTETPLLNAFSNVDMGSTVQNMKVDKMVRVAIQGILKDKAEILPGMAKVLKLMGRIAPRFFLNFMDGAVEKGKRKSK
ncbi:short-chain dehydrogenase [Niastella koreensis]|uniref:Short-chain dehydrogenase/reductase SDR n=2 Tax=Niastella koreensis TaxID=354356 RepID=G8TJ79_NIAKG|nr:SDR family NAD(P)-dependent oxidoreductase [Niastella koreensis]AEV98612.1 short-chain dehydrogenase/reductase SDR [Niastella koreensis GR20-10]OQP52949.1 short-chain dehydrogenase [Niastella koreensis]